LTNLSDNTQDQVVNDSVDNNSETLADSVVENDLLTQKIVDEVVFDNKNNELSEDSYNSVDGGDYSQVPLTNLSDNTQDQVVNDSVDNNSETLADSVVENDLLTQKVVDEVVFDNKNNELNEDSYNNVNLEDALQVPLPDLQDNSQLLVKDEVSNICDSNKEDKEKSKKKKISINNRKPSNFVLQVVIMLVTALICIGVLMYFNNNDDVNDGDKSSGKGEVIGGLTMGTYYETKDNEILDFVSKITFQSDNTYIMEANTCENVSLFSGRYDIYNDKVIIVINTTNENGEQLSDELTFNIVDDNKIWLEEEFGCVTNGANDGMFVYSNK